MFALLLQFLEGIIDSDNIMSAYEYRENYFIFHGIFSGMSNNDLKNGNLYLYAHWLDKLAIYSRFMHPRSRNKAYLNYSLSVGNALGCILERFPQRNGVTDFDITF